MLQEVISYLVQHPEIAEQVKNGSASLIGVSQVEQQAIVEVLNGVDITPFVRWN